LAKEFKDKQEKEPDEDYTESKEPYIKLFQATIDNFSSKNIKEEPRISIEVAPQKPKNI